MEKQNLTDKEIADGIFTEVELTMQRIQDAHDEALTHGEFKRDAYSRMKGEGWWDARKILDEYIIIKKKESVLPVNLRLMIIAIFELASTNFWAKQIKKESDNTTKKQPKKKTK